MADNFINKINVNNEDYFLSPTFTSQTKNYVLAAPSNANGVPSFRKLVAADIPDLSSTYLKLNGSNNMTADVNIIAGDTDKFINFWYNTNKKAGASWRIGNLGSGSSDANYFVIQSGTSDYTDTTWTDALRIGMNTHNVYIPSTTASTSTSTGALTVGGGLGVKGDVYATSFIGNGSALTNLNASNINSGTVPSARLPIATSDVFGAVKVGSGISVSDGTISVTAGNLGLSSALRYCGTTTTVMSDGLTTAKVKINNADFTPTAGDVVIYNDAEYLWTGSLWELIGAESSFKKVQTAVNSSSASGSSATTFVSSVTQDTQGVITVKTSTLNTSGTWSGTATNATNATTATYIKCTDTRSAELEPVDMTATQGVRFDFKAKSTINLTATDGYAGVMTFRPYAQNSDWSGGPAHQLAFNRQGIHWRTGTSAWNAWERLATANEVIKSKVEIIRLA